MFQVPLGGKELAGGGAGGAKLENGFVALETAVAKGEQWGPHHFVLKHRKLWAAAELIAGEVLPQTGKQGNKQRDVLLAFCSGTLSLALHRARQILTGSSSVLAPHSRQMHRHLCVQCVSSHPFP